MWKVLAFFCLLSVVQISQCQFGGAFDFTAPDDIYLRHYWNWRTHTGPGQVWPPRANHPAERRDTEVPDDDGRDREPLGPDYKDPETLPDPDETGQLPDIGVIDVDANGYPSGFPSSFPDINDNSGSPNYGVSFPGFFNFFGSLATKKPWWNGPNVCVERQETIEEDDKEEKKVEEAEDEDQEDIVSTSFLSSINLSTCRETYNKYECITKTNNRGIIKTFTVKYKCCHGYRRSKDTSTCSKLELKPLLDTIEELGAKEFRKMITSSGLEEKLREENITIFIPSDEALNDFTEKMLEMNQVELDVDPARRRRRDLRHALSSSDLILNHVIDDVIDLADVTIEEVYYSDYKNSTIRVNSYPTITNKRLLTVNCVPVKSANNLAETGIVHVIDGVIMPGEYTIKKIINQSKKLNMLKKILENPALEKLFDREGPYTFLAPTDEAFEKLDTATKQKLMRGDDCAVNILKYHFIASTICSPAINGNVTVHNIEGTLFNMERKENDDLIIQDDVKIIKPDIIATDGVIHLVDTLMLPESGLHISQALKKYNLTKFGKFIEEVGLMEEMDNLKNATVFVPTDKALEDATKMLLEKYNSDKTQLTEIIRYHVLPGKIQSCDLNNNEMKDTKLDGQKLRVNLYSTLPLFTNVINRGTVNCAKLLKFDEKSCGSIFHTIDKVLFPPTESILDIVNREAKYSILRKLIKGTEIEKILKDDKQSITLLAPSDEVFDKVTESVLNAMLEDKEKANEVLKHHILTEVLCCSGVGSQSLTFNSYVPSLADHAKEIRRNSRHQVRIGKTTVTECDTIATNGVIHEVNNVMFPSKHQYTIPGFGSLFMFEF